MESIGWRALASGVEAGREGTEARAGVDHQEGSVSLTVATSQTQEINRFGLDTFDLLQHFFYNAAQYQSEVYALAGTIGFLSGITGRAYNTPTKTGCNQSILVLGDSGSGKDSIASGTAKLYSWLTPKAPTVVDFRGPGELVSSAGLVKWLNKQPCVYSIVGEIGKLMAMMVAPNAPQHLKSLNRTVMQLTSKSGHGETFDPIAYSDMEKNTAAIKSPSFTLLGESVPGVFYEALDESMIVDGWAGRFLIFEEKGKRSYRNKAADTYQPNAALLDQLANLVAHCSGLIQRGTFQPVHWTDEAEAKFDEFERWTTDKVNEAASQAPKEVYNRGNLKAIRLASVKAIARNYLNPIITLEDTMWATGLVVTQTENLIAKITSGDVGEQGGNQTKQQRLVLWAINDFLQNHPELWRFFPGPRGYEFAKQGVVPHAHISQRIAGYAAFKNDRLGASAALKRTIKELLDSDFIRQVPPTEMAASFSNYKGIGYVIANEHVIQEIIKYQ